MSLVLALGAGGPTGHVADWSERLLREAHRRGHEVIVADTAANVTSVPADTPGLFRVAHVDYADVDQVRDMVEQIPRPDAVVAFREFSLLPASTIAEEFGLPWNTPRAINTCRQKDRAREALRAAGLTQPSVTRCPDRVSAARAAAAISRPFIVKPADAFGSQGVRLVDEGADLESAIAVAFGYSENVLIEEFVEGREFSVEGIIIGGKPRVLAVTRKTVTPPPFFVELAHRQPSGLTEAEESRIGEIVVRAVAVVGLTHSHFHVEVWLRADGVAICGEVHARVGGDWIHALTAYRHPELDLFGAVLDDVLGDEVDLPPPVPGRSAASVAVFADELRPGEAAQRIPASVQVLAEDWYPPSGRPEPGPEDSFGRHGLVVLGSDDAHALDDAVSQLSQRVPRHRRVP